MSRSELRQQVMERDNYTCLWPSCGLPAVELAHLHSIGVGGRKSADDLSNLAAFCRDHARISDGEYGSGGEVQYEQAHADLFGVLWGSFPRHRIAFERAEALTEIVRNG